MSNYFDKFNYINGYYIKLLLIALLTISTPIIAEVTDCKPPIKEQVLTYQKTNNTPFYFAGFIIELPPAQRIGYFNDNLILKYGPAKSIYLTFPIAMLSDGRSPDYDPVAVYKEAFGLLPKQAKNNNEIKAIVRLQRLCDNELISYKIANIDYNVIRTKYHNSFSDKQSIDTFILGEPKEIYMIGFKGFTDSEIDKILATIHKQTKK